MGLIKAVMGAASGVMGDQWKEYFYCDALPAEVLAVKGQKRTNGRSANRHGSENVISDGSVIAVADGQCVLIVEQGKVVDLCAEPGEYTYNTGTIFAGAEDEAAALLEEDKDPGLGVRGLQAQGITGKGVRAAIIDQPLLTDHPELSGRIAAYYDTGCEGETASMHGPAVASLFAGESIGIAPDAALYYAAWPSWLMDSRYAAEALDWVVAQNEALPDGEKIRIVSVSAAPGNAEMFQNADLWDAAVARAEQAGLLVLTVDGAGVEKTRLVPYPAVLARNDRDNPAACRSGFADSDERAETGSNTLSLPCSYRTVAEEYTAGQYSYTHDGHGGLSWGIPYCAGVMALGWQVDPTLTGEEMMQYLLSTAATGTDGSRIIDPVQFIQTLQTERGA